MYKPHIALCTIGSSFDSNEVEKIESHIYMLTRKNFFLSCFRDFNSDSVIKNLFNVCWNKQQYEYQHRIFFDICIAINANLFYSYDGTNLLDDLSIKYLLNPELETLYFLSGKTGRFNGIQLTGFFCNSFLFDLVCNYSLLDIKINEDRLGGIPTLFDERFYWFLKSYKIKTQCINYENSNLFKRSTPNN